LRSLTGPTNTEKNSTSTKPRLVVRVDWPSPIGTKYYSEQALTISGGVVTEARLVSTGVVDMPLNPDQANSLNVISDFSFVLRDEDAVIREYVQEVQTEKSPVYIYQHFVGNAVADLTLLMKGMLSSPISKDTSRATMRFDVEDVVALFEKNIGTIANQSDFPDVWREDEGKMLPIAYGKVPRVQSVCIQRGYTTVLAEDIDATQDSFHVKNGEHFPQGENINIRVGTEEMRGSFDGVKFTAIQRPRRVHEAQTTHRCGGARRLRDFRLPVDFPTDNELKGYRVRLFIFGFSVRRTIIAYDARLGVIKVDRPFYKELNPFIGERVPRGATYYIETPTSKHSRGEIVEHVLPSGIVYACNDAPSRSITNIEVRAQFKIAAATSDEVKQEETENRFTPINPSDYVVKLNDTSWGLGHGITTIRFKRPLDLIEPNIVEDGLWVTFKATVDGSNNLIEDPDKVTYDLLTRHAGVSASDLDLASFNAVNPLVNHLDMAFALHETKNGLDVAADLAFQSRSVLVWEAGKGYLRYLTNSPAAAATSTVDQDDIQLTTPRLSLTPVEQLFTSVYARYTDDDDTKFVVVEDTSAISAYGRIQKRVELWAYQTRSSAAEIAAFWLKRWAFVYEWLQVRTFLTRLEVQRLDTVEMDAGDVVPSGVKGIVEHVKQSPGSGTSGQMDLIELEVRLPRGPGCDTSLCEICQATCETGQETCVACETGEACAYCDSCQDFHELSGGCGVVTESAGDGDCTYSEGSPCTSQWGCGVTEQGDGDICQDWEQNHCTDTCMISCEPWRETGWDDSIDYCPTDTGICDSIMCSVDDVFHDTEDDPNCGETWCGLTETNCADSVQAEGCGWLCESVETNDEEWYDDKLNVGFEQPTQVTDGDRESDLSYPFYIWAQTDSLGVRGRPTKGAPLEVFNRNIEWHHSEVPEDNGLYVTDNIVGTDLGLSYLEGQIFPTWETDEAYITDVSQASPSAAQKKGDTTKVARSNHEHGFDGSAFAGTNITWSGGQFNATGGGGSPGSDIQNVKTANAAGSNSEYARDDHEHAFVRRTAGNSGTPHYSGIEATGTGTDEWGVIWEDDEAYITDVTQASPSAAEKKGDRSAVARANHEHGFDGTAFAGEGLGWATDAFNADWEATLGNIASVSDTTGAVGSSTKVARADHKHLFNGAAFAGTNITWSGGQFNASGGGGTPGSDIQNVKTSNAAGSNSEYARDDHEHAFVRRTSGNSDSAHYSGLEATGSGSDEWGVIWGDSGGEVTDVLTGSPSTKEGTTNKVARIDHEHGFDGTNFAGFTIKWYYGAFEVDATTFLSNYAPRDVDTYGGAAGIGTDASKSDHKHGFDGTNFAGNNITWSSNQFHVSDGAGLSPSTEVPLDVDGTSGAAGSGTPYSREDHEHGFDGTSFAGSNISWSGGQFNATNTTYTAGDGLDLSGTEFSVKLAASNPGLEFVGTGTDELDVKLKGSGGLAKDSSGLYVVWE